MNKISLFLQKWSTVLIDPVSFFKNNKKNELLKIIPYIAWIVGISNSINRIDSQINKGISIEIIDSMLKLAGNNWLAFWLVIFVAACIGGVILWYFNGLIFRILTIWSKGDVLDKRDFREKATVLGLISSIPNIMILLIGTISFKNFIIYNSNSAWSIFITVPFIIIERINMYKVAIGIYNANKRKSIFWFIIAPILIIVILIIVSVYAALINKV